MAAAKLKPVALEETKRARALLNRVIDKQGLVPVRNVFDAGVEATNKKLRSVMRGRLRSEVTQQHRDQISAYLVKQTHDLGGKINQALLGSTKHTVLESLQSSGKFLHRMTGNPSIVDDPVRADALARRITQQLAVQREIYTTKVSRDVSVNLVQKVQERGIKDPNVSELLEGVEVEFDKQWWRLQRLIETETSRAYNLVQVEVLKAAAEENKKLMGRWTERIDDRSHRPMDKFVAADSIAMHGQVALPGELFTMPAVVEVRTAMHGKTWEYPPNRPHDRAVLTPWMRGWGVPAWVYRDGERSRA